MIAAFFGVFFFRLLWPLIVQALSFLLSVFLILLPLILFLLTGVYTIASFEALDPMAYTTKTSPSPQTSTYMGRIPFIGKKKKNEADDDLDIELQPLTHQEEGAFFFADDLGPVAKMASGWGDSSMTVVI